MDFHQLALNNIATYLKKGKWQKSLDKPSGYNFMNSFVGRRLLHRHLRHNVSDQAVLNACSLPISVKKSFFSTLESGSKRIPQGSIIIEGDMAQLKTSDWLDVELNIIKQALTTACTVDTDAAVLISLLNCPHDSHHIVRSFTPKWAKLAMRADFLIAMQGVGIAAIVWGDNGYVATAVLSLLFGHMALWAGSVNSGYSRDDGDAAKLASQAISKTWHDVFEMKTDMDAVLLGVLFEIHNTAKRIMPGCALPNFFAMPPHYAYLIAMQVLNNAGHVTDAYVKSMLSYLNPAIESDTEIKNSHIVDGVDLSAIVFKEALVQDSPAQYNDLNQPVHQVQQATL